ncbi:hypothetical protein Xen7305DRAFT_00050570 [Xenococcus sp. PCC 7305]|uniref:hypothetical protein n=1 Tax=Xenococcus sp. PCC 7305 TaxID=102125 RepID=UPI0002AC80D7|nr:hypothetical protein [Xenococcus sp. PCC 7305]ELS05314.1 hypothetical protein Xen7305DRAFT_00050570 [Xenococcus sp. PCC 7305]
MLNRFKLLVLAIILAVLTVLFLQNQELLSLRFFCSDTSSDYCFYQTPAISLAVWMAIFILLGVVSSLIWQLLNRPGNLARGEVLREGKSPKSRPYNSSQTKTSYPEQPNLRKDSNYRAASEVPPEELIVNRAPASDWEQSRSEEWETASTPNFTKEESTPRKTSGTRPSKADNSYKFKQDKEPNQRVTRSSQAQQDRSAKESSNSEFTKTSVPKNTEDIYDASYRTLNNVPPPSIPEDRTTEDEDPDWI